MGNEHSRHQAQQAPPQQQKRPQQYGQYLDTAPVGEQGVGADLRRRSSLSYSGSTSSIGSSYSTIPPGVTIPPGAELIGPFIVESVLGKGSFAEVKLGRHIVTQDRVALKIINKNTLSKGKRRIHLQREIRYMKLLSHPYIASLYEIIEDADHYVLIMEHSSGGELLQYIRNADKHRLSERESRRLFRQIISGVDYCHQHWLIHRDIKPENILLDANGDIKIIDFGFSREFQPDVPLDSFIGSPHYAAPELLQGIKYSGPEVDIWSLGVLLYVMICGRQPFKHPDMKVLYSKIIACEYEFPDFISASARDLITRILRINPRERLTMEQIKNHPWVCEEYGGPPPSFINERPPILSIDPEIFEELLTYGFEADEARAALLSNQPNMVCSFYHLLMERRERLQAHQAQVDSLISASASPTYASPLSAAMDEARSKMVRDVETGEMVPISQVDRNVRRQIRQNSHYMQQQKATYGQ